MGLYMEKKERNLRKFYPNSQYITKHKNKTYKFNLFETSIKNMHIKTSSRTNQNTELWSFIPTI